MTNQAAVAIIIRIAGILTGLDALGSIFQLWTYLVSPQATGLWALSSLVAYFALEICWIVIAAIMVCAPLGIANKLLPRALHGEGTTRWTLEEVQTVALSLLGVWLLVTTFTNLQAMSQSWIFMATAFQRGQGVDFFKLAPFLTIVLRVIVGIWLLFGAKGLRGLLRFARGVGT